MTQLVQNFYVIAPYIFMLVLVSAAVWGLWLVAQLRRDPDKSRMSVSDRLFLKRNAARMRNMQLH
ncbi:hypothetical protein [Dyadobacter sandarakinus]|uniref:Heme exporter protein D n=1 Tax=Dyadobacter sandarakinus TaxID=2747268 RepID=A0ABX7IDY1_9BACT|nr:hypothetical protein [Dyadobacter sandarakinus]QRR03913.1 hypothetical protein HWI92_24870 [Dyadobacter sandarakinus]